MDTETSEDGHHRATTNEEKYFIWLCVIDRVTVHFTGNAKLYYVNNDRRVEYKSLGFKGFFIIFYNLYNLKENTEEVTTTTSDLCYRNSLVLFVDSLFWQCHAEAKPVLHLWNSIVTGFFFFLIVFSNRFAVWLMKPEVNWQGNCDQVICITQLDTLNYRSWFVIRLTVSTMRNAASICLPRLRKAPRSCTTKTNDGGNVIMKIMQENICRVRSRNEIEAWNVPEDCEALPKKRNAMLLRGKTMNRSLHLLSDKSREFDSLNYVCAQRSNFVTRSLINYVTSSESTYVTLCSNCV